MKLDNIQTIEAANIFLKKFINQFNNRFAFPINNIKSVFEKQLTASIINHTLAILEELSRNKRFSEEFDVIPVIKEKKKYIPPMSHPWKLASFKRYLEKAHASNTYA